MVLPGWSSQRTESRKIPRAEVIKGGGALEEGLLIWECLNLGSPEPETCIQAK